MEDFINVDLIKFYMWENKLTKKDFCKLCQISTQTLNKILNQKMNEKIKNIESRLSLLE